MALLYDRTEKPDEIIIVYKHKLAYLFIVLIAFVTLLIPGLDNFKGLEAKLLWIIAFILIGGTWKPGREIRRAMKNGKVQVQVSGGGFSFSNSLTYTITNKK